MVTPILINTLIFVSASDRIWQVALLLTATSVYSIPPTGYKHHDRSAVGPSAADTDVEDRVALRASI